MKPNKPLRSIFGRSHNLLDKYSVVDSDGKIIEKFRLKLSAERFAFENEKVYGKLKVVTT